MQVCVVLQVHNTNQWKLEETFRCRSRHRLSRCCKQASQKVWRQCKVRGRRPGVCSLYTVRHILHDSSQSPQLKYRSCCWRSTCMLTAGLNPPPLYRAALIMSDHFPSKIHYRIPLLSNSAFAMAVDATLGWIPLIRSRSVITAHFNAVWLTDQTGYIKYCISFFKYI